MKKTYLLIVLLTILFVGCGTEDRTTIEENAVSSKREQYEIDRKLVNSPYKNSKYIFIDNEAGIQQYLVSGEFIKTIEIEKNHRICFVDEKNIYYSIPNEKYDMGADIYFVSVEDDTISHIVTEKDGIFYNQFFVYDDYLCYVSRIHKYKEFDLKRNSRIKFEKNIQANCELLCKDSTEYIMGKSIFLSYGKKGVFLHTLGTEEMKFIGKAPLENLCIYQDVAFYLSENGHIIQIQYENDTIKTYIKVHQKEIEQAVRNCNIEQGDYYIKEIIINNNKLYVSIELEKGRCENVYLVNLKN